MPKPMHCAQEVYDIIRLCWEKLPMDRLSFATLHERLDTLSHSKVVGGFGVTVLSDANNCIPPSLDRVFLTSNSTATKITHSSKTAVPKSLLFYEARIL